MLIGDIHGSFEANTHVLVEQLLAHFQEYPEEVPDHVSLWIIPTMNPDGLATGHRWNAHNVDLNRNADTDLDGCAGNDWSPDTVGHDGRHPGAGGAFPFSEPETRAVRDFLEDAWVAVFYHSAAKAIFVDTCQRHEPTARLAQSLSSGTGYPVPEAGWSGYPITGDFSDYLAGEGVAAVILELTDHDAPEFERNLEGVRALLADVDDILTAEATGAGAEYVWLDESNSSVLGFSPGTFIHPLALESLDHVTYLLDGGRVLALGLDGQPGGVAPAVPGTLLSPGDEVAGVRVLEPLDLARAGDSLLVLDRAGDVYRYDPATDLWAVERYDRPSRDIYDHYFVALDASQDTAGSQWGSAGYLLETSHEQVWRFPAGQEGSSLGSARGAPWIELSQSRDIDLSAHGSDLYVLTRALNGPKGELFLYRDGRRVSSFQPNVDFMHPRQVLATGAAVYVLDRAGRRLLALNPEGGNLQALYQFPGRGAVSAMGTGPAGEGLILAGRDALYLVGETGALPVSLEGAPGGSVTALDGPQPHDPGLLGSLRGLQMPIEGAAITSRDFQMPGAPRHYRLGVHEGMDFYGHSVGVPVDRTTPVRAVADGVVIRALVDYEPLTAGQANAWVAESRRLGYTPPDVLDGYRGMQVWIDHGSGLVSRYAHLSSITPGVVEGAPVARGQVIATVGNSGTPASVQSQTDEVHLHLELWLGEHHVGQFLRPIEAREWLERVLR